MASTPPPRTLVVPFRRPLKLGSRGSDVIAVKRALHKLGGYYHVKGTPWTPVYGPFLKVQMRRWQKHHMKTPGDGSYGQRTHTAFVNRHAFDAYGAWLMRTAEWNTPEERRRDAVVRTALFGAARRSECHYTQSPARMAGVRLKILPPNMTPWEDCSSFATWCYWVADQQVGGVPDPNGLGWNGYGFTGTQISHGRKVTAPKRGSLIFYGNSSTVPSHVTIYVGDGKCVSHGNESGPQILNYKYRGDILQIRDYL